MGKKVSTDFSYSVFFLALGNKVEAGVNSSVDVSRAGKDVLAALLQ